MHECDVMLCCCWHLFFSFPVAPCAIHRSVGRMIEKTSHYHHRRRRPCLVAVVHGFAHFAAQVFAIENRELIWLSTTRSFLLLLLLLLLLWCCIIHAFCNFGFSLNLENRTQPANSLLSLNNSSSKAFFFLSFRYPVSK